MKCVSTLMVASTVPATLDTPSTEMEGPAEVRIYEALRLTHLVDLPVFTLSFQIPMNV